MRLTIIICTWNRAALLRQTLETLRAQDATESVDMEILVVDNNSADKTPHVVRELALDWPLGALRYLREERQGKQFALNRAIAAARGDVLAFTDDDVMLPQPDWVHSIAAVLSNPNVEMAGGKRSCSGLTVRCQSGSASNVAVVAGVDLGDQAFENPAADYAPAGTNLIVRREVFDRIEVLSKSTSGIWTTNSACAPPVTALPCTTNHG